MRLMLSGVIGVPQRVEISPEVYIQKCVLIYPWRSAKMLHLKLSYSRPWSGYAIGTQEAVIVANNEDGSIGRVDKR
eukprot:CAMPEP_0113533292 /NCGR_PEP_ID=MMETSP0015_2-20120614/4519_1 /TAXON_ID=2838 /ORGANISM="Odontella" /LENGTH=75 /DNA_ID=CAMNT_0000432319 /DNA_START=335 /DNA_END=562 /DNA_ORIENTATION=- /assembly_acc=CAM_ASM_000160